MAKAAKQPAIVAPQNKEGLNEFIRQLGELQRQQDELNAALARKLDEVTAETTKLIQPLVERSQALFDGIAAYTSAHREELTEGDKVKTIKLPAGECIWRWSPWAVVLKKKVPEIVAAMKELKLERFIRTKEEPDKEKMLREQAVAEKIAGVEIKREEVFTVKPVTAQAEITKDSIKKGRPKATKKASKAA